MIPSIPNSLKNALTISFKKIQLIACSGRVVNQSGFEIGIERLASTIPVFGTEFKNSGYQRFSGTDEERLAVIENIAQITEPTLLMGVRGGYGISRILHQINYDLVLKALKNSRSVLSGHSDFTALQLAILAWCQQHNIFPPSLWQGPMLCADFGAEHLNLKMCTALEAIIASQFNKTPLQIQWKTSEVCSKINFVNKSKIDSEKKLNAVVWGGNLTLIAHLIGTPYLPQYDGGILIIEDVNEHPYRIERMLWQLLHSNVIKNQKAIIFSEFTHWKPVEQDHGYGLNNVIDAIASACDAIILNGFPFGHVAEKATWPQGLLAELAFNQNEECTLTWDNELIDFN